MRFTILGPVEVLDGDEPLSGLAPRHRAVLAYLLLHARTAVDADRLIAAMWGDSPPGTARSQIHAAVTSIRQVLRAPGATELLATRAAGYVALPGPAQLDLDEFTERFTAARRAAAAGEGAAGASEMRVALGLWRGQPLAGVGAAYVPAARATLEERRLTAVEQLMDLELSLDRHEVLVEELNAHVVANPLRERLTRQLMLALHRSGRQADALAAARTFRATLVEQQGLDPSRAFATLERGILQDDQRLHARAPSGEVAGRQSRATNFLPYGVPDFVGRVIELDWLDRAQSREGRLPRIAMIDGMAGIGKTTLAVHAGRQLAPRYPDGQLFVDLQAHTAGRTPVDPGTALEVLLRQLGVAAERIPASPAARAALWRAELADRRVLVVLDNASGAEQVRPLLPGVSGGSLVLITSRRRLTDLDGARAQSLYPLPARDAVELFTAVVGDRAHAEPVEVLEVAQLCGFLPLAVRIAAARLHHRPRWTVEHLVGRLRDERRRLRELSTAERGIAAAFNLSYEQLEPDQRRMFRLAGLHPGRDLDAGAAAALAGVSPTEAELLLEDLLDAHVLLQHEPNRYTFHDLLREHARTTAAAEETAETRRDALGRLFDHYACRASVAVDQLYPYGRHLRPRAPEPEASGVRFEDAAAALAWLDAERANLIATGTHAAGGEWSAHTLRLAATLFAYLDGRAHHTEALPLYTSALAASGGDPAREANALLDLDVMHSRQGRHPQASEHSRRALELAREAGDRLGEARALHSLGEVHRRQHDYDRAHEHYLRALDLYRQVGDRLGEAIILVNLGLVHERRGRCDPARAELLRALDLFRELGLPGGEGDVLDTLGLVSGREGRHDEARAHHRQALEIHRRLGYQSGEARALNGLAENARAMGDPARAVADHGSALTLALGANDPTEQARAHAGLALAHRDLGEVELARRHARLALDLYTGLGVPEAAEARRLLDDLGA